MLASDSATLRAVLELRDVSKSGRPVLLWIGAGASRWAEYPTWEELADHCHTRYLRLEEGYDVKQAKKLLATGDLPLFFSFLRNKNSQRFNLLLSQVFVRKAATPVFKRFAELLGRLSPLYMVTTNVDEMLETQLPTLRTLQRTDLEIALRCIGEKCSFLCKLHGTASSVASGTWTIEDYQHLTADRTYVEALRQLLRQCSVVFVGYSLRDQYLLNILAQNELISPLLGSGPHFCISTSLVVPPSGVKVIRYAATPHSDHRGALSGIDVMLWDQHTQSRPATHVPQKRISALYLPDYLPPGTWNSSHTLTFESSDKLTTGRAVVGNGFINEELTNRESTSLHDLLVGLICFEKIYLPIGSLGRLHLEIGSDLFWHLVNEDAMRFIRTSGELSVAYGSGATAVADGSLSYLNPMDMNDPSRITPLRELILNQIRPATKSEAADADVASKIERITVQVEDKDISHVPTLAQGTLTNPKLRAELGIGDAILPSRLPFWFAFPALRVASILHDAEICRLHGISSAKLAFASAPLTDATYGLSVTDWDAAKIASYVVSGSFNANLGKVVMQDSGLVAKVLQFRSSALGLALRQEVMSRLATNEGSEFAAAVNSGLSSILPHALLDQARQHFIDVRTSANAIAVWSPTIESSDPFALWRKRSAAILREHCEKLSIGAYDQCPCGSGDKLKFCCGILF